MFDDDEDNVDKNATESKHSKNAFSNGHVAKTDAKTACANETLATEAILSHRPEHRGSIDL